MAELKTTYTDDVLDTSVNIVRKYTQIQNDDGTVSFLDNTVYSNQGTAFGAKDINSITEALNNALIVDSFDESTGVLNTKSLSEV